MSLSGLLKFLDNSPTACHATSEIVTILEKKGYSELSERDAWSLEKGKGYYIQRNGSSVVTFYIKDSIEDGFKIIGSHTDSPLLKLKPDSERYGKGGYRIRTETYGGPILSTWFDKKLLIAGRAAYRTDSETVKFKNLVLQDIHGYIPNLAIHLNREVNKGFEINKQNHLNVLLSSEMKEKGFISEAISRQIGIEQEDLLMYELFAVPAEKAEVMNDEFIISGRIDNLTMCYASADSLPDLNSEIPENNVMCLWFDSEEVGSRTRQGGASSFMDDIIKRLAAFEVSEESYYRCKASSFLISADGAHAVHPSFSDKHDADYAPEINKGPVIKINAGKAYATEVESGAYIINLMKKSEIPFQKLINRSDLPTGSTIGPIVSTSSGIRTIDLGIPMLGMHSSREICGVLDIKYIENLFQKFWN